MPDQSGEPRRVVGPVIVGPNASDPAAISDDALSNVDNVYVMDDGQ